MSDWTPEDREELRRLLAEGVDLADSGLKTEVQELERQDVNVTVVAIKPEAVRDFETASEILLLPAELVATVIRDSFARADVVRIGLARSRRILAPYQVPRLKAETDLALGIIGSGEQQLQLLLSAYSFFRREGDAEDLLRCQVWLANGLQKTGLLYDCLRVCEEARPGAEELGSAPALGALDCMRGQVLGRTVHARDGLRALDAAIACLQPAVAPSGRWLRDALLSKLEVHSKLNESGSALEELAGELRSTGNVSEQASVSFMIARTQLKSGQHERASEHVRDAMEKLSSVVGEFRGRLERDRLLARNRKVYELANEVALDSGNSELALLASAYADSVRSIGKMHPGGGQPVSQRLQEEVDEELRSLSMKGAAVIAGDTREKQEFADRARSLVDKYNLLTLGEAKHTLGEVRSTWPGIQLRLQPDAGLLKLFVSAKRIGLAFATRTIHRTVELPVDLDDLRVIQHKLSADCLALSDSGALDELARLIASPFDEELRECASVLVHGFGQVGRLPVHAFEVAGLATKDVRYLVGPLTDQATLDSIELPGSPNIAALGVAETAYKSGKRLEAVEDELNQIERHFPGVTVRRGSNATAENLFSDIEAADIVHLACHAEYDAEFPLLSRLYLYDRPYFVFEWLLRPSRPGQLVVLNACESGMTGSSSYGETLGLGHAVAESGSFVIGTSWPVADRSALRFVDGLYEGLARSAEVGSIIPMARQAVRASPNHSHVGLWGPHIFIQPVL